LGDIFADLLTFAAKSLVEGGRLVFWIPVNREHYSEDKLPTHPNLKMVANCEQWLSSHTSRRCVVLEKVVFNLDKFIFIFNSSFYLIKFKIFPCLR
jgi:tRNA (guanine10-N2)-methyltransferase